MKFNEQELQNKENETVLDLLLRNEQAISYSCKSGNCQSCLMKSLKGEVDPIAQRGLKSTLISQGCFLACQQPAENIELCSHVEEQALFGPAKLIEKHFYNKDICRLRLELSNALYYHAGQFINLKNPNGVSRSYSLASLPSQDASIELHVRRKDGGEMSNWLFNDFNEGDYIDVQGPIGDCFYRADDANLTMMLVGTGTGAAPLIGIARDAIQSGHSGDIHFYHGASNMKNLYLHEALKNLQSASNNFFYHPCVDATQVSKEYRSGQCNTIALSELNDAKNTRLFLCGNPQMVILTSKKAFMSGVSINNILTDPFEYKDMRKNPR